jgi:hypothetical protein
MLAELRDMGPQSPERLQELLMFDEKEYSEALAELVLAGLVEQGEGFVRATVAGVGVINDEREGAC